MIDRRPGLIAQCSGAADVIAAVNFARTHGLLVAVRGGGHSGPGTRSATMAIRDRDKNFVPSAVHRSSMQPTATPKPKSQVDSLSAVAITGTECTLGVRQPSGSCSYQTMGILRTDESRSEGWKY
jgi:hypothetical protein